MNPDSDTKPTCTSCAVCVRTLAGPPDRHDNALHGMGLRSFSW